MNPSKKEFYFLLSIISFYSAIGIFFAYFKWDNFLYKQLDLSIFVNALKQPWSNFLYSTIQGHNYLGDHFMPYLILIKPLFDLFNQSPMALLILGVIIIALWFIPIYLIAKQILGDRWSKWITVFIALNPVLLTMNLYEFHPESLGILFLLWAFYFYQKNNFFTFSLFYFFTLISREDAFLFLLPFIIFALLDKRDKKWWLLPIVSLTYLPIAYSIIGHFNPSGQSIFFKYYGWLGGSLGAMIWNSLTQPWRLMGRLLYYDFLSFALQGLMLFLFLPIFKLRYLLIGALPYAAIVFGPGQGALLYKTHYAMPIFVGLVIASIYGLKKITDPEKGIFRNDYNLLKILLVVSLVYLNLGFGPYLEYWNQSHEPQLSENTKTLSEALTKIDLNKPTIASEEFLPYIKSNQVYFTAYILQASQQFFSDNYHTPADIKQMIMNADDLSLSRSPGSEEKILNWSKNIRQWHDQLGDPVYIKNSIVVYNKENPSKLPLYALSEMNSDQQPGLINYETKSFDNDILKISLTFNISGSLNEYFSSKFVFTKNNQIVKELIMPWRYGIIHRHEIIGKSITIHYYLTAPEQFNELKYQVIKVDGLYTLDNLSAAYQATKEIKPLTNELTIYSALDAEVR